MNEEKKRLIEEDEEFKLLQSMTDEELIVYMECLSCASCEMPQGKDGR